MKCGLVIFLGFYCNWKMQILCSFSGKVGGGGNDPFLIF